MGSRHAIDAASGQAVGRPPELTAPSYSFLRAWAGSERMLLVEPDNARRTHLRDAVGAVAEIDSDAGFLDARTHLISRTYDWLVTNIRLGTHNGLHLVHLAGTLRRPTRSLVYDDQRDLWLAREAQRVGAFYESADRLVRVLPAYLRGALPPQDRRNPADPERRVAARGGRRCTDCSASSFA